LGAPRVRNTFATLASGLIRTAFSAPKSVVVRHCLILSSTHTTEG
jgi:hypothetical protein